MSTIMSGNIALPGMLHAGVKAAPSKKKGGPKRRKALLERGRFWAEIQKNKVMEDLFKKYDVSNTVGSLRVSPSGGEFAPPCRCVSWVGSLQEPAACVFAGAGGRPAIRFRGPCLSLSVGVSAC